MVDKLKTETYVKLDFIDRVKVLFGREIKVSVNIDVPVKVEMYNGSSKVEIVKKSKSHFTKDRKDFGYCAPVE